MLGKKIKKTLRHRFVYLRGATHLGFMDVLTALIMLAILAWAASRQFPIYNFGPKSPRSATSTP